MFLTEREAEGGWLEALAASDNCLALNERLDAVIAFGEELECPEEDQYDRCIQVRVVGWMVAEG